MDTMASEVVVDAAKTGNDTDYDITFHVIERTRVGGSINTTFGSQNSGSISTGLSLPNINGRGESLNLSYSYGNKCSTGFDVLLNKPLLPWTIYNPNVQLSVFQKGFANPWNGLTEISRGSFVGLAARLNDVINGNIYVNSNVTSLSASGVDTPFKARMESGHFFKDIDKYQHKLRHEGFTITANERCSG